MAKKRILHLIPMEKITTQVVGNFNEIETADNYFFILKDNSFYFEKEQRYIPLTEFSIDSLINDYLLDSVIVHGLYPHFAKLISEQRCKAKIAWFVWGFDIYSRPKVKRRLYAPETIKLLPKGWKRKNWIKKHFLLKKLYYAITQKANFESYLDQAYNKINYFCTYMHEDYAFFDQQYKHHTEFFETPFCTLEQYLAGNSELTIDNSATDILVGNSNSLENNHLDAFIKLQKIPGQKIRILVPLSYGNDLTYKSILLKKGTTLLRENFYPLLEFIERDKYLKLLAKCSTAVFYHFRQQAMGNIIALLYMGMRVYLSTLNPAYHYCKRVGLQVFDFDKEFCTYYNTKLDSHSINKNRTILLHLFNKKQVTERLTSLVEIL